MGSSGGFPEWLAIGGDAEQAVDIKHILSIDIFGRVI
jgi:hypothetical protein